MSGVDDLYRENILEHYKHPRNRGTLERPDITYEDANPLCGDRIRMDLQVKDGRIEQIRFSGVGCSISQAAASMMTQVVKDKRLVEALALADRMSAMMHGDESASKDKTLGDLRALAGVAKFPIRVKCALLPWNALRDAVKP